MRIKDEVETAVIRTRHGTAIHAANIPERDDILGTRLRQAGAILARP